MELHGGYMEILVTLGHEDVSALGGGEDIDENEFSIRPMGCHLFFSWSNPSKRRVPHPIES